MESKDKGYKELTLSDRRAIFSILYMTCKHGKVEHGKKVRVAEQFNVHPRTVNRVWAETCSVMEAHLINEMELERLSLFDQRMLPIINFPDFVFDSAKKGNVGRKKVYDREVLGERLLNVPLNERGTYRNLASQLDISKDTAKSLVGEGVIRIHTSALKPFLTDKIKDARYLHATSKIDLGSLNVHEERAWQYKGMFNEVHVDEKWFDETFETRKYFLGKGEPEPLRQVTHKKHIPKIMFLAAQARPRYDPSTKSTWDGKISLIPIGNWVRQQRKSPYYKKGDARWKNRNVDTQAYFECMEDIVRGIASKWPRGQWNDPSFVIHIQQDGARCHTSALFNTLWQDFLIGLFLEGVIPSVDKVQLATQPARSPDLNLLDNGLFNALQSQYKKYAPKNAKEMLAAVDKVWRDYPHKKINHMWLTIQLNCDEVIKCNGGNDYKIRHMKKERLEREGILPTVIQVSLEARQLIEEGIDEEYLPTAEEEAEMEELDGLYGEDSGYVPPEAITAEELDDLLSDREPEDDTEEEDSPLS